MNIAAAAIYMKMGYRVRRTSWGSECYMCQSCGEISIMMPYEYYTIGKVDGVTQTVKHRYLGSFSSLSIDDLLAEDWELITTGIRKHFSKYSGMEYNDDKDWDNYVAPKSSWDEEDETE